jgi:hypothetical protein
MQTEHQNVDAGVRVVGREVRRWLVRIDPRRGPGLPGGDVALLEVVEREPGQHALAAFQVKVVGDCEHPTVMPRMPCPRRLQPGL